MGDAFRSAAGIFHEPQLRREETVLGIEGKHQQTAAIRKPSRLGYKLFDWDNLSGAVRWGDKIQRSDIFCVPKAYGGHNNQLPVRRPRCVGLEVFSALVYCQ